MSSICPPIREVVRWGRWGCRTRSTRSSPKGIGASIPGRRGHRTRRMPLEWPRGSRREPMIPGQDCSPGIAIRFRRETWRTESWECSRTRWGNCQGGRRTYARSPKTWRHSRPIWTTPARLTSRLPVSPPPGRGRARTPSIRFTPPPVKTCGRSSKGSTRAGPHWIVTPVLWRHGPRPWKTSGSPRRY